MRGVTTLFKQINHMRKQYIESNVAIVRGGQVTENSII